VRGEHDHLGRDPGQSPEQAVKPRSGHEMQRETADDQPVSTPVERAGRDLFEAEPFGGASRPLQVGVGGERIDAVDPSESEPAQDERRLSAAARQIQRRPGGEAPSTERFGEKLL
jgi:hypothetical protein